MARIDIGTGEVWHEIEDNTVMEVTEAIRHAETTLSIEKETARIEEDAFRFIKLEEALTQLKLARITLKGGIQ